MAIFNPDVPDTKDPNYLGYSKPITQPEFKSGTAIAIKEAGDLFSGAVKSADELIKQFAQSDARQTMVPERDQYTAVQEANMAQINLANMAAAAPDAPTAPTKAGGIGSDAVSGGNAGALDILQDQKPLPGDLERLPGTMQRFDSARASGKISETDFWARTRLLAKDLRSRYPVGYHDYIDSEVSKVLGVDPANAYIKSLMGDINSYLGKKEDDPRKQVLSTVDHAIKDGVPGAADLWTYVQNGGKNLSGVMQQVNAGYVYKYKHAVKKADLDNYTGDRKVLADMHDDLFTAAGQNTVSTFFSSMELTKPEGVVTDGNGNWVLDSKQAQAQGQMILNKKNEAYQYLRNMAMEKDKHGNSYMSLNEDKFEEKAKRMLSVFDFAADRMLNDKSGQAFQAVNLFKAIQSDEKLSLYRDKDLGWIARKIDTLNATMGPDAAQKFIQSGLSDPEFTKAVDAYYKVQKLDMANPRDPLNPKSLKERQDDMIQDGIVMPKAFEKFYDIIDGPGGLVDKTAPMSQRLAIARALGNPKNDGIIADIKPDFTDGRGIFHPGKYHVWNRLTQADVAQSMWELSGNGTTPLWNRYQNFVEKTFSRDLLQNELKDLNAIPTNKNLGISWDTERNQWNLIVKDGDKLVSNQAQFGAPNPYVGARGQSNGLLVDPSSLRQAQQAINKINSGLKGVTNMATVSGNEVGNYLFSVMTDVNINQVSDPLSLPGKALLALQAAHNREEKKTKDQSKYQSQ